MKYRPFECLRLSLLLGSLLSSSSMVYAESAQPLDFSETKYEKEWRVVYEFRKSEIEETVKNAKDMDYGEKKVTISIAVADLDHDGRDDILAFLDHPFLCGSWGCELIILLAKPDGDWQLGLEGVHTGKPVLLSRSQTKGFTDIILGESIWKWNGTAYHFSGKVK